MRALFDAYHGRGVRFLSVDSEATATQEGDAVVARARRYPFPIVIDADGSLAEEADAQYATYSIIIDRNGAILYRGGIDSDRTTLSDKAEHYLRNALEDVIAGRAPAAPETKALGCVLRRR
ncbi:MAG: hypothetical protein NVS3B20_19940 [Polyangiales bacterium]